MLRYSKGCAGEDGEHSSPSHQTSDWIGAVPVERPIVSVLILHLQHEEAEYRGSGDNLVTIWYVWGARTTQYRGSDGRSGDSLTSLSSSLILSNTSW